MAKDVGREPCIEATTICVARPELWSCGDWFVARRKRAWPLRLLAGIVEPVSGDWAHWLRYRQFGAASVVAVDRAAGAITVVWTRKPKEAKGDE